MSVFEVISYKTLCRFHCIYMSLMKRTKCAIEKHDATFLAALTKFDLGYRKFPTAILFFFLVTLNSFCSQIIFVNTLCLSHFLTH